MDWKRVAAEALAYLHQPDRPTPEELDTAAEDLIANLRRIADQIIPRRKRSVGHAAGWSDADCKRDIDPSTARYQSQTRRTAANKQQYKEAQDAFDESVRKAQRRAWRNVIAKASKDCKAIWQLECWARLKNNIPAEPP